MFRPSAVHWVGAALLLAACAGDGGDGALPEATGPEATGPDTTVPDTTGPEVTGPEVTFDVVESDVTGTTVGGSAGNIGEQATDRLSATVREADGTCRGWDGPGGTWTQGLVPGAPLTVLEPDADVRIGGGRITTSAWADADPGPDEQWNCTFEFEATVEGDPPPASFRIRVAELRPWTATYDPATDAYVAWVETPIHPEEVGACSPPAPPDVFVSSWRSVGRHWADGLDSICRAGLVVAEVEPVCRPAGFAADHVVMVVSADDPSVVLEDRDGLRVDPSTIGGGGVTSLRRPASASTIAAEAFHPFSATAAASAPPDGEDTTTTTGTTAATTTTDPGATTTTATTTTTDPGATTTGAPEPNGSLSNEVIVHVATGHPCT